MARSRLELDWRSIRIVGEQVSTAAARAAAERTRERVRANISRLGRIDSGDMLDSVSVRKESGSSRMRPQFWVGSDLHYTGYQEEGTRAHGPVKANMLVFTPKGSSVKVFTPWVRGVTAGRFFRDARDAIRASDFRP